MDDQMRILLEELGQKTLADFPELVPLLEKIKSGEIPDQEAIDQMAKIVHRNPVGVQRFTDRAFQALPIEMPPNVMTSTVGLPKVNPLVHAAIAERLQFDQDAPELRTGPIPEGVLPALSVQTQVRDPVAMGRMIRDVALDMREQLSQHEGDRRKMIGAAIDGNPEALALVARHGALVAANGEPDIGALTFGSRDTDLPGYRRGEVPVPVARQAISGSALAMMSSVDRKESAWNFVSTTQGRRSAVNVIRRLVAIRIQGGGIAVTERDFNGAEKSVPVAVHQWTVTLAGPGSTQPAFAVIDTAAAVLAKALTNGIQDRGPFFLEVVTVDTFADREVGWAARLMR